MFGTANERFSALLTDTYIAGEGADEIYIDCRTMSEAEKEMVRAHARQPHLNGFDPR